MHLSLAPHINIICRPLCIQVLGIATENWTCTAGSQRTASSTATANDANATISAKVITTMDYETQ